MKKLFTVLVLFLVLPSISNGTQVLNVTAEDLTKDAADIFYGKCLDVKMEQPASQLKSLGKFATYTFEVKEVVKGGHKAGEVIKVTQLTGFKGAVSYVPGREYFLFLAGKSPTTGATSPVGLSFGKFDIKIIKGIRQIRGILNPQVLFRDFSKLKPAIFKSLTPSEKGAVDSVQQPGAKGMNYDDFVSIIKKISAENGK